MAGVPCHHAALAVVLASAATHFYICITLSEPLTSSLFLPSVPIRVSGSLLRLFECSIGNICESAVRVIYVIHVISVLYLCSPRPQIIRVITQSSCVEIFSPGSQICIEGAGVKMQRCRNGNCPMC